MISSEASSSLDTSHHGGSIMTAEEASAKRELVKKIVKSILCSSKDGITEHELRYEYRSFTNEIIPYAQLGYKSLYELVKDFNVANISRLVTGQYVFRPIYDELTQELGALVTYQIDRDKTNREMRREREGQRVRSHTYNRFGSSAGFSNSFIFGPKFQSALTSPAAGATIKPFVPSNVQKNIQAVLEAQDNQTLPIKEFQLGIKEFLVFILLQDLGIC